MNNAITGNIGLRMKIWPFNACRRGVLLWLTILLHSLVLTACGGGASTESQQDPNAPTITNYNGPTASTEDVQAFKLNVWDNLKATNRCGTCHGTGGQTPAFVRQDDVNLAYSAAISVVNLSSPVDSQMVAKVGAGHNCWLTSDSACAAELTAYIQAWAGSTGSGSGKQISLTAPVNKDPGSSKNFPVDTTLFETNLHTPLLTQFCSGCHTDSSLTPQSPYFANSDVATAYDAAKSKIDMDTPANSRFVLRLREEFHNCWSGNCQTDAQTMQDAITAFANGVPLTQVDPQLVVSKALKITDGVVASGGTRHESNVIALYQFKTGQGTTAFDTSGVTPSLHLSLSGGVSWVGGYGIEITSGKAQGSTTASKKLSDFIKASGEYSIEGWVVPANVTQEDSRIISYSAGTNTRNFTLGQSMYNYDFLHRSSTTNANGEVKLSTADADEDLQATLQHVVITFDPVNGRRIYVNGIFTGDSDPVGTGNLTSWDDSFAFVLGNEVSGDRLWKGKLRLVAIHNRALTQVQVTQNFDAGVGEKYFLLFNVSTLVGVAESYILFEVSQFDSYSYLFNKPTFISLDANAQPGNIAIEGIRIGINGRETTVGQAYRNVNTAITNAQYDPATGQVISSLGTIIANEKGPDADEFFLTFEVLGNNTNVVVEPTPLQPANPPDNAPASDIGLRTFDEINATMAEITKVDPQDIKATYDVLRQQLPAVETIEGFLSAHQMAISQLAISYCDNAVEDATLRTSLFGAFSYGSDVVTAFGAGDSVQKNSLISTLFNKTIGLPGANIALSNAPDLAQFKAELIGPAAVNANNLYDRLAGSCSGPGDPACQANRTRSIVKAMCASTLGSAAMLVQ